MQKKIYSLGVVIGLFLAACIGCNKSDSKPKSSESNSPTAGAEPTVARLHWLGKKRLATEGNAARFMGIWDRPESAKLQAQTLDKLATAPWRLLPAATPLSNAPSSLLRPLLDDLVSEEFYAEVQTATNQPGALALAVRLDADRAALWRTNLPIILQSIYGASQLPKSDTPKVPTDYWFQSSEFGLALTRAGEWTLLSIAPAARATSPARSAAFKLRPSNLVAGFAARIQQNQAPFAARTTNFWLEADGDLRHLVSNSVASNHSNLPRFNLTLIGDGTNVRTRAELDFPNALSVPLNSWQIPTNLVREPLIAFGAVRGLRGLLAELKIPTWLGLADWPDQFYSWGRSGPPLQIYAAFPTQDATNDFARLSQPLADWIRAHLPANNYGALNFATNKPLLTWDGLYFGVPSLRVASETTSDYLLLGLAPIFLTATNQMPEPLIQRVLTETNLIALAWEFTAERLPQWRYFDDTSRMTFDAARRPRLNRYMASIEWVANLMTNLEHSVSEVRLANPSQLTFTRKSTVGLTGWEINVLANWLELPEFPAGFTTLFATNSAPPMRRQRTPNAVPKTAP